MLFQIIIQNMGKGSNVYLGIDRSPLLYFISDEILYIFNIEDHLNQFNIYNLQ